MIPEEKRQAAEKLVSFMPYFVNTKYEDAVHWIKNDSELGSVGNLTRFMKKSLRILFAL